LEGLWEAVYGTVAETVFVHTVRGKPGYLFGTKVIGDENVPAQQITFWVRSGNGVFQNVLEGKAQVASAGYKDPYFVDATLYWYSDDAFDVEWKDHPPIVRFTRSLMVAASKSAVD